MDAEVKKKYSHIPGNEAMFPIEDFHDFHTSDGFKLHTYRYPSPNPRCLFINFHGVHSYSNNYAIIAKHLSEVGCEVVAFDFRGHGKSEGPKGLLPPFAVLLDDCLKFLNEMQSLYPNLPVFLVGGSLGACICIHIQSKVHNIKGMVLFSPAIRPNFKCHSLGRFLLKGLNKLSPTTCLIKPDPKMFCPNEELAKYLEENPYCYTGKVRVGTMSCASEAMEKAVELVQSVQTAFVVIQGGDDQVVDPEMAEILYNTAPAAEKKLWMYSGLSHALIFENAIFEMCQRLQEWVVTRLEVI